MSCVGMARAHWAVVQIRSMPDVIFRASVFPDIVQVHAGESRLEMSSTREMSRPATGLGTDGVIATSLAAHGPDGIATRVTGWSGRLPWCFRFGVVAAEWPFIAGPPVPESCAAGEVAATSRAVSS